MHEHVDWGTCIILLANSRAITAHIDYNVVWFQGLGGGARGVYMCIMLYTMKVMVAWTFSGYKMHVLIGVAMTS